MDGVDACFGMHGMLGLETGYVDITPGYRMIKALQKCLEKVRIFLSENKWVLKICLIISNMQKVFTPS